MDYILETFQTDTGGLKHNEENRLGEFRTKRLVLEAHDAMAKAEAFGIPYKSPLNPVPGRGGRHPAR